VTINLDPAQPNPSTGTSVAFAIQFSEAVDNFVANDVTISGTASSGVTRTLTGGPVNWTLTLTGITSSGTIIASVPENVADDQSTLNNPNTASPTSATATLISTATIAAITPPNASEAGPTAGSMQVTLNRSSPTATQINISYSGSATSGSDYTAPSSPITIPANTTVFELPITVLQDFLIEGNETVTVTLDSVASGGLATIGSPSSATVTIADNDTAGVTVTPQTLDVTEGGNDIFNVSLTSQPASNVVINLSTSTQCSLSTTSLTFTNSDWSTPKPVTVTANNDSVVEGPHQCVVLTTMSTSEPNYTGIDPANVTVNITDDDTATLSIVSAVPGNEAGPVDGTLTVTLSNPVAVATTVALTYGGTALDPADYVTDTPTPLVIPANTTSVTITLDVNDDFLVEGNETVIVTLGPISGPPTGLVTLGTSSATNTIADNDGTALLSIAKNTDGLEQGEVSGTLTVTLSAPVAVDTVVTLGYGGTASNPADYGRPATVTIDAGETEATVTLTVVDDPLVEGNETVEVTLLSFTGPSSSLVSIDTANASDSIGITDNDGTAELSIVNAVDGAEPTTPGTLTVKLSKPVAVNTVVTLTYGGTADDPDDYTADGTVTILAGELEATLTLTVADDSLVEGDETVDVTIASFTGPSASLVSIGSTNSATNTIADDDGTAELSIVNAVNGAEPGTPGTLTVKLSKPVAVNTVVTLTYGGTADDPDDYTADGTVTILAGELEATLTLTVADDSLVEGDETVVVTLASFTGPSSSLVSIGSTNSATNTIADDDGTAELTVSDVPVNEGDGTATFIVTLDKATGGPFTLMFTFSNVSTVAGDFGPGSIPVGPLNFEGNAGETQTVVIPIFDDSLAESDETAELTLGALSSDFGGSLTVQTAAATLTIEDNDTAGVNVSPKSFDLTEGSSGPFSVSLTSQPTADVVINLSTSSQCTLNPTSLTFTADDWETAKDVQVTAVDDDVFEGNHDCIVVLTPAPTNADQNYVDITIDTVTVDITDVDTAGTGNIVGPATEGGPDGFIIFSLDSQPLGNVSLTLTPDAQCTIEGQTSLTVVFNSGNWRELTVSVEAVDDNEIEPPPQVCNVTLSSTDDFEFPPVVEVEIIDNDSTCPGQQLASSNAPSLRSAGPEAAPMSAMSAETFEIAPAEAPVPSECTDVPDQIVQPDMEALSYNFMAQRLNLLASNGPRLAWLSNRAGGFGGTNGFQVTGENGDLTGNFAFSSGGISNALNGPRVMPTADAPGNDHGINAWIEGQFAIYGDERENEDASGDFFVGYAGIDFEIFDNVNLGIMGSLDWMDEEGDEDDRVEGTGWMVGPYLSAEIGHGVFLDLRAMYGKSDNSIRQINRWDLEGTENDRAVEHKGDFETERFLAEATLTGNYAFDNTVLTPDVRFLYIREDQSDYTVACVCGPTDVNGNTVELAQLSGGLRVSQLIAYDDHMIRPFISGRLSWNIGNPGEMVVLDDNTLAARTEVYSDDPIRGMISIGLDGSSDNLQFGFEGSYDGIFSDGDHAFGGRVSLGYRF
jgi:hypothetical protein